MAQEESESGKALDKLAEWGQIFEEERLRYEAENDAWWNGLSEKEREDAFYAVCKRLYEGEVKQKTSYRYVLYDIFGFDPGMYIRGMDCGYMAIHNAIVDLQETKE